MLKEWIACMGGIERVQRVRLPSTARVLKVCTDVQRATECMWGLLPDALWTTDDDMRCISTFRGSALSV